MPPVDRAFSRRAGFQAYLIGAFSLAYAVVFLGFVRRDPSDLNAAAVAAALLAGGGLSATIAVVAAAARVSGDARWWLTAVGVGYGLLSAVHGVTDAIANVQGLVLVTGGLASVILVPAFWIWTGRTLRR